ncbi:MAG: protein-glutamate O-methyltransferase, partial [Deltaproteobacteria bacterium]|nr:protein-glutamate O-methyltransferase [Deltaproteobacteria bacterium]
MLEYPFNITDKEFKVFQGMIHESTGIYLSEKKRGLLVARLSKRLRALNLKTFGQYYKYLQHSPNASDELIRLINRITTNKTDFFREKHHFDFLYNELLPSIIDKGERSGRRRLRIWSAGCSSGEEPYSIAIVTTNAFKNKKGWDVKILATDLDTDILRKATEGIYPAQTVSPIPQEYISRFFKKINGAYHVKDEIKGMIVFRRLNLMDPAFPMKGPFDIIFCRNVIIYFDLNTKINLISKFYNLLKEDGYIFVGHSESLMQMRDKFR